ncbi:hypothetical protein EBT31_13650, partial [bacterium]|nr:hypothetical protein [bacterium]
MKPEFEFFPADTKDPIGKYTQPKPCNNDLGMNGYPETDVKTTGIQVRGGKAQTKGKMARGPMA